MLVGQRTQSSCRLSSPPRPPHRWWVGLVSTAVVAAVLCLTATDAHAQGAKFAVIDMRRAVIETEDGLRVQSKLKQLFDSRQTDLDQRQKDFQASKAKLEKQAKTGKLAKKELQRKYDALQKQAGELQSMLLEYQREMQRQETELTNPIVSRMMTLIRRVAAQNSYDMVVDRAAVPYFRADLDITDRLIQMYNVGESSKSPAKGKKSKKRGKKRGKK